MEYANAFRLAPRTEILSPPYLSKLESVTKLTPTICKAVVGQGMLLLYSGPNLWNNLPPEIRQSDSIMLFKKLLKTNLFRAH